MSFYLLDNPPRRSQYRKPRRERPSGVIVLHSTESLPDVNPPDTGAENVARFIRTRTSLDIGNLAPGAISPVVTVRNTKPSDAALSLWWARIVASAASYS